VLGDPLLLLAWGIVHGFQARKVFLNELEALHRHPLVQSGVRVAKVPKAGLEGAPAEGHEHKANSKEGIHLVYRHGSLSSENQRFGL
jgi:hypothetical protein